MRRRKKASRDVVRVNSAARARDAEARGPARLRANTKREGRVPEVYVHAVEGRTAEQKKALMKDITDAVMKNFNVPAELVVVTIMEARKAEKMKGGKLFTER